LALALASKVLSSNTLSLSCVLRPDLSRHQRTPAANPPTFASSIATYPIFGSLTPDKAVDGRNLAWALTVSSSCFVSEADNNPWWTVKPPETSKCRCQTGLKSKILVSVFVSRVWSHSSSSSSSSSSNNNSCSRRRRKKMTVRQRRSSSSSDEVSISVT